MDYRDRIAVDREVLAVRERLSEEYGTTDINFYREPFRSMWLSREREPVVELPIDVTDADTWLKERFGGARVWALSPGEGARLWKDFRDAGIAAIGWDELGDLADYETREAVHDALAESTGQPNPFNDSLAVWQFANEMSEGDVIIAKKGRSSLLGWGRVTGGYRREEQRTEYRNVRPVEWHPCESPPSLPTGHGIATKTLTDVTRAAAWVRAAFHLMESGVPPGRRDNGEYPIEEAMQDLFLPSADFRSILDQLRRRKNVILQGPPGVGKTFIARRVAYASGSQSQ